MVVRTPYVISSPSDQVRKRKRRNERTGANADNLLAASVHMWSRITYSIAMAEETLRRGNLRQLLPDPAKTPCDGFTTVPQYVSNRTAWLMLILRR